MALPLGGSDIRQLEADIDNHLHWYRQALNGPPPGSMPGLGAAPRALPAEELHKPAPATGLSDADAPMPGSIPDTRGIIAGVMDEMRRMVFDELGQQQRKQQQQLKEFIEQEWQRRLEWLDYRNKERHQELSRLFEENRQIALHIGGRVLKSEKTVDDLRREASETAKWREEAQQQLAAAAQEIEELKEQRAAMRRAAQDAERDKEQLQQRIAQVAQLRDEVQQRAARLEADCDSRLRPQLDDLVRRADSAAQERRAAEAAAAEWQRQLAERTERLERASQQSQKEGGKLRSKAGRHADDIRELRDAVDELHVLLGKAENPGYCGGCRLIREETDKKLFTVKQSICFLDERLKPLLARCAADAAAADAGLAPPAPGAGFGGPASPAAAASPGSAGGHQHLVQRVASLEARLADAREAIEQVRRDAASALAAAQPKSTGVGRRGSLSGLNRSMNSAEEDGADDLVRRCSLEVKAALIAPLSSRIDAEVGPIRDQLTDLEKKHNALDAWTKDQIERVWERV